MFTFTEAQEEICDLSLLIGGGGGGVMDHCHRSMDESIPRYQFEVSVLNGSL